MQKSKIQSWMRGPILSPGGAPTKPKPFRMSLLYVSRECRENKVETCRPLESMAYRHVFWTVFWAFFGRESGRKSFRFSDLLPFWPKNRRKRPGANRAKRRKSSSERRFVQSLSPLTYQTNIGKRHTARALICPTSPRRFPPLDA